jgi:phage shock protein C
MYCTKCGVVLEGSDLYCSQCGTPTARLIATSASSPVRRLTRAIYDKKIGGVCGGLAQYLAADSTFVRLIWLIATICFPPLLVGYIGAWILLPKEAPRLPAPPLESTMPHSQPQATSS